MRKEQSSGLIGFVGIMIFLILGSGFYYLIQRPIRASDWDKVNLISCAKLNNQEVFCKQKHSALFGLFPKNTEFNLLAVDIKKYEGGEDPDEYVLHVKTNNGVIEINDFGDDYERAYKTQQLLMSIFHEPQMSEVKIKYTDGLIKISVIGFLGLMVLLLGGYLSSIYKRA